MRPTRPEVWRQHHGRCPCITEQPNVPCTCPPGWPRRAAWWCGQAVYGARRVEALLRAAREEAASSIGQDAALSRPKAGFDSRCR